jgi:nucleoside-diphosphate-sugar epimerase
MKILVTGSEGSLMQAVIPYLIANGHEVVGADSLLVE